LFEDTSQLSGGKKERSARGHDSMKRFQVSRFVGCISLFFSFGGQAVLPLVSHLPSDLLPTAHPMLLGVRQLFICLYDKVGAECRE
jgi:hypothetical protein